MIYTKQLFVDDLWTSEQGFVVTVGSAVVGSGCLLATSTRKWATGWRVQGYVDNASRLQ